MKNTSPKPFRFLWLLLLAGLAGCQNNSNQNPVAKQRGAIRPTVSVSAVKHAPAFKNDTTIISQEFSYNVLNEFNGDTNKVRSLFLDPIVKKMERQTVTGMIADSLCSFSDGINKISLNGRLIRYAEINNNRVRLNKKLSMGMKLDDFLLLLNAKKIRCDTIEVKDEEETFESVYIFKNNQLRRILIGDILE